MRDFAGSQSHVVPGMTRELAPPSAAYGSTRARVEHYFDRTATQVWERLTSDAPVSKIRATVRAGRDQMRAAMLARLPEDLTGARVLDAGCGTGLMTAELAARGAEVMAVDISPNLVDIAAQRLPEDLASRVTFAAGDMLAPDLGGFDYAMAMDSLIYYDADDIAAALRALAPRVTEATVFTVAPRTPALIAMWRMGKLFPRKDRAPVMIPHSPARLRRAFGGPLTEVTRVTSGFYISTCLEHRQ